MAYTAPVLRTEGIADDSQESNAPSETERRERQLHATLCSGMSLKTSTRKSHVEQKDQVVWNLVAATFGYACRSRMGQTD